MSYTCKNCGAIAEAPGHLCSPCEHESTCNYCGEEKTDTAHVCKEKLAAMKFVCENCGRVAPDKDNVCAPCEIK